MSFRMTTSEQLALQPATSEMRDAWEDSELAKFDFEVARLVLTDKLEADRTRVEALSGDLMQETMMLKARSNAAVAAESRACDRWVVEYVRLRGVSERWARRQMMKQIAEFGDE